MNKYVIIGRARHGKDTAAMIISDFLDTPWASSSLIASTLLFDEFFAQWYPTPEAAFFDRENHRDYWFDAIAEYTKDDPARLANSVYKTGIAVYCGVRRKEELYAIVKSPHRPKVIWIDASKRISSMTENVRENFVQREDASVTIDNNGTIDDLRTALGLLLSYALPRRKHDDPDPARAKRLVAARLLELGRLAVRGKRPDGGAYLYLSAWGAGFEH